jgi:hypothetical protein
MDAPDTDQNLKTPLVLFLHSEAWESCFLINAPACRRFVIPNVFCCVYGSGQNNTSKHINFHNPQQVARERSCYTTDENV